MIKEYGWMNEIAAVSFTVQGNYNSGSGISWVSVGENSLSGLMKRSKRCKMSGGTPNATLSLQGDRDDLEFLDAGREILPLSS